MSAAKTQASRIKTGFIAAFLLTLLTWIFFYITVRDAPLNSQDTAVAFGFWFLAVLAIEWVRDRLLERKKAPKKSKRQTAAKS